jgi:type IV secretion system protein VirD4
VGGLIRPAILSARRGLRRAPNRKKLVSDAESDWAMNWQNAGQVVGAFLAGVTMGLLMSGGARLMGQPAPAEGWFIDGLEAGAGFGTIMAIVAIIAIFGRAYFPPTPVRPTLPWKGWEGWDSWHYQLKRLTRMAQLVGMALAIPAAVWLKRDGPPGSTWAQVLFIAGAAIVIVTVVMQFVTDAINKRVRGSAAIAAEQEKNMAWLREVWRPIVVGGLAGAAIVICLSAVGVFPQSGDDFVVAIGQGVVLVAYLAVRPVLLKCAGKFGPSLGIKPDNLLDAGILGFISSAAVAFAASALWVAVVEGTYNSKANFDVAMATGYVGAIINVWIRCAKFDRFPRFRLVLGGLIAAGLGALALFGGFVGFQIWHEWLFGRFADLPNPFGATSDQYIRGVVAIGAISGVATYSWWRLPTKSHVPRRQFSFIDFALSAGTRTKLLVGGLTPLIVGGVGLYVFRTYVQVDLIGPDWWPWLRWTFIIGFVLISLHFGDMFIDGLTKILQSLSWSRLSIDTHGQARTATERELRDARLAPHRDGIYVGRFFGAGRERDEVEYPGGVHLITIGPTGSGKGTGLIIPNLSELRRSILIIDPKGEAAAVTARKRAQFGRVVMLNPFNILTKERPWLESDGFNPLARFDKTSPHFIDDAVGVAEALVRIEGSEPHWSASAQDLVAALVMHEVMTNGRAANIGNVRRMLTEPLAAKDGVATGLAGTLADMELSDFPPLKAKIGKFRPPTPEIRNIISAATTQTRFLDSPPIVADLASTNNFSFADMKDEIVTVYLILPATHLETHSNWLRLMIVSALRALLGTPSNSTMPPVLFILDEFAQLGYLPAISNAMNIARSFGVQLWPIVQDLNQLHTIYKDNWQNFLGARGVLTSFAPRDLFTAKHLSELCGKQTVIVESENERTGSIGMGRARGPQSLPLFRPEELMSMPPGQMLCFVDPVKNPFIARAPGYWATGFNNGLDENPYYQR